MTFVYMKRVPLTASHVSPNELGISLHDKNWTRKNATKSEANGLACRFLKGGALTNFSKND